MVLAYAAIHALGWTEFEDGLRMGVELEVSNGLQGVCTELMVKIVPPPKWGSLDLRATCKRKKRFQFVIPQLLEV